MATKAGRRYVAPHLRGDAVEAIKMDDESITKSTVRNSNSNSSNSTLTGRSSSGSASSSGRSSRYQSHNGYPPVTHSSHRSSAAGRPLSYQSGTGHHGYSSGTSHSSSPGSGRYPMSSSAASTISTDAPPGLRPGPSTFGGGVTSGSPSATVSVTAASVVSSAVRGRGRGRGGLSGSLVTGHHSGAVPAAGIVGASAAAASPYTLGGPSSSMLGSELHPPQRQYVRRTPGGGSTTAPTGSAAGAAASSSSSSSSSTMASSLNAAVSRHSQSPSSRFSQSPTISSSQTVEQKKVDRTLGDWRRTPKTDAVVDSLTDALPSLDLSAPTASSSSAGISATSSVPTKSESRPKPKSHRFGQMFPADERPRRGSGQSPGSPHSMVSESRSQPGRSASSPGVPHHGAGYASGSGGSSISKSKRSSTSPSRSVSSDRVINQYHQSHSLRRGRANGATSDNVSMDKSYPRSATESPLYGPYSALSGQLRDKPASPMKLDSPLLYKSGSDSGSSAMRARVKPPGISKSAGYSTANRSGLSSTSGISSATHHPPYLHPGRPGVPVSSSSLSSVAAAAAAAGSSAAPVSSSSAAVPADPAVVSVVSVQTEAKSVRTGLSDRSSATPPGIGFQRYARKYDTSASRSPISGVPSGYGGSSSASAAAAAGGGSGVAGSSSAAAGLLVTKRAISPLSTAVTPSSSARRGRRGRGAAATSPLSASMNAVPPKSMVSLSPMSAVETTVQPVEPPKVVKPPPMVDEGRGRDKKPPPNWAKGLIPKRPRVPESATRSRPRKPPIRSESDQKKSLSGVSGKGSGVASAAALGGAGGYGGGAGKSLGFARERLPHSETPGSTPTSFYPAAPSHGRSGPPTSHRHQNAAVSQAGWSGVSGGMTGVSRYGVRSAPDRGGGAKAAMGKVPSAKSHPREGRRLTADCLSHVLFVSYVKERSKVADMLRAFNMNHTHIFSIPNGRMFVSFRSETYAQSILKRFSHEFLRFAKVDPSDYLEVYSRAPTPRSKDKVGSPGSGVPGRVAAVSSSSVTPVSGPPRSAYATSSSGYLYAQDSEDTPDRSVSRVKVDTEVARRMIGHHLNHSATHSQSQRQRHQQSAGQPRYHS